MNLRFRGVVSLWLAILPGAFPVFAGNYPDRWWPVQAFPKAVLRTTSQQDFPEPKVIIPTISAACARIAGNGSPRTWAPMKKTNTCQRPR